MPPQLAGLRSLFMLSLMRKSPGPRSAQARKPPEQGREREVPRSSVSRVKPARVPTRAHSAQQHCCCCRCRCRRRCRCPCPCLLPLLLLAAAACCPCCCPCLLLLLLPLCLPLTPPPPLPPPLLPGNGLRELDCASLPPQLGWLIATENKISALPGVQR